MHGYRRNFERGGNMNYRIVGQDGKIYGPLKAETIREWIAQGRVDSRTPIFVEGQKDWSFVGLVPEFSPHVNSATPFPLRPDLTMAAHTNGFATAGFVCGLLSCCGFCCCCFAPVGLLGIIFSIVAMVQIKSSPVPQKGWGLALAGLICSAVGLLVDVMFGLLNGVIEALTNPAMQDFHMNWK